MNIMYIDPKVKSLTIFNSGGGIVEREIKLSVQQGINEFQILNVPAVLILFSLLFFLFLL